MIEDESWLRSHVEELTHQHERGRGEPWAVSDAPPGYIEQLLGELWESKSNSRRLEGKWKLGQNRSEADRRGVLEGLRAGARPLFSMDG